MRLAQKLLSPGLGTLHPSKQWQGLADMTKRWRPRSVLEQQILTPLEKPAEIIMHSNKHVFLYHLGYQKVPMVTLPASRTKTLTTCSGGIWISKSLNGNHLGWNLSYHWTSFSDKSLCSETGVPHPQAVDQYWTMGC